jgi:hypothetical protein
VFLAAQSRDIIASDVGVIGSLAFMSSGASAWLYASGSSGGIDVQGIRPPRQTGTAARGRTSWREIVK